MTTRFGFFVIPADKNIAIQRRCQAGQEGRGNCLKGRYQRNAFRQMPRDDFGIRYAFPLDITGVPPGKHHGHRDIHQDVMRTEVGSAGINDGVGQGKRHGQENQTSSLEHLEVIPAADGLAAQKAVALFGCPRGPLPASRAEDNRGAGRSETKRQPPSFNSRAPQESYLHHGHAIEDTTVNIGCAPGNIVLENQVSNYNASDRPAFRPAHISG